jgi:hypothetical protein
MVEGLKSMAQAATAVAGAFTDADQQLADVFTADPAAPAPTQGGGH